MRNTDAGRWVNMRGCGVDRAGGAVYCAHDWERRESDTEGVNSSVDLMETLTLSFTRGYDFAHIVGLCKTDKTNKAQSRVDDKKGEKLSQRQLATGGCCSWSVVHQGESPSTFVIEGHILNNVSSNESLASDRGFFQGGWDQCTMLNS